MSTKRIPEVVGTSWLLISASHILAALLGILTSSTTSTGTGLPGGVVRGFLIAAGLTVPAMWCAAVAGAGSLLPASRLSRVVAVMVLTAGVWILFGFRGTTLGILTGSAVIAALLASSWIQAVDHAATKVAHEVVLRFLGWIAIGGALAVGAAAALLAIGANDYLGELVGRGLTFSFMMGIVTLPVVLMAGLFVAASLISRRA